MLQAEEILQNRYQLKQKLGDNAARQTWLAADLEASDSERNQVVVKLLVFGSQVQWENLKLFEREAQVLNQLNHPRIPKYKDYFCVDERSLWFGLVQEYIPGSSLKEQLAQGKKFTEQQVRKIAIDVLNILIYLHELSPSVLHRDIKPSNLIWGEDEQVYLVDFGAVQDKAAKEGATFTVVGTYGYAPIEQFGGRAVPASDLYALGSTLIHLLTGIAPADLPYRDLRIQFSDRVSLNPSFVRWLESLTEPAPEKRFSSARQALKALETGHPLTSSITVPKPAGSRVQLRKFASGLEIKIPGRGIQLQDTFLLFWLGFWYAVLLLISFSSNFSTFFMLLPWWLAGILPLSMLLLPAFGQIYLYFDGNHFEIEWKLFGQRYRRGHGQTSDIHNVCETEDSIQVNGKPLEGVTVQVGVQKYTFGSFAPPLADVERSWLVQELKDWLRLK